MPGTKRLAVKLVALGSVLTGGGAGTYWYTTGRGMPFAAPVATADSQSVPVSTADLNAVASAWAVPASPSPHDTVSSEASPLARSAEVTLAHAEVSAPPTASEDRYAQHTPTPTVALPDLATEESTRATTAESTGPTPAEPAGAHVADAEPPHELTPLARGQEPDGKQAFVADAIDGAALAAGADETATDTIGGAENTLTPFSPTPKLSSVPVSQSAAPSASSSLPSSENDANLSPSARRARQAFRDQQPATDGDRYSAAAGSRAPASGASESAATVNPFTARVGQPAGAPIPREFPQSQADQSLPASEAALDRRPLGSLPAARTTTAQPTEDFRSDRRRAPLGDDSLKPLGGAGAASTGELAGTITGTGKPGEQALEGPQKPSLLIQKFAPGEIQVGKAAKFVVQIRNVGGQTAQDVVVRDEVPHGTRLVSSSPKADCDGSHISWQIGSLSAGEERLVEMLLMPTTEGEVGSVATVTYAAQASVKTRCTMPQLAIRMTSPSEVMIGQDQHVKIELKNPGSGDATKVMMFENVPQNVRHAAGPALEFEIGTLRAGETRELELILTAEKAGKVVNTLSARAEGNLLVQQSVEFEVIAPALSVAVNGPERRYLERPATYEVSVENPGTAPAHDVQLVTKLPKGMQFVRANNMGEYDAATHAVYWSLAELPKGEKGTVELVAMPVETGPQTLEVQGRAQQGLTDQAKQQIVVEGLAAIMFEVRDLEDPIEVGKETGYEIRVVNQGTKAATNVQVKVAVPAGLQIVSAEGETSHAVQAGNLVFEPLPQLAPKADTLYRIKLQGLRPGDQRVSVEVNTDDLGQPIHKEESTRVFGDD